MEKGLQSLVLVTAGLHDTRRLVRQVGPEKRMSQPAFKLPAVQEFLRCVPLRVAQAGQFARRACWPSIGEGKGGLDLAQKHSLHALKRSAEGVGLRALLRVVTQRVLQCCPQRRVQFIQFGVVERVVTGVVVG